MHARWTALLFATAAGCGPPEGEALVLLSREAREAGALLSLDTWDGAPLTPVAIRPGERFSLNGERLELQAGALGFVDGRFEVRWRRLDADLDPHRIEVQATPEGANRLASALSARARQIDRTWWSLAAPEILSQLAWSAPPDGVFDMRPVALGAEVTETAGIFANWPDTPSPAPGPRLSVANADAFLWVGVYRGQGLSLLLDAEGGYVLRDEGACTAIDGHWSSDTEGLLLSPRTGAPTRWRADSQARLSKDDVQLEREETQP